MTSSDSAESDKPHQEENDDLEFLPLCCLFCCLAVCLSVLPITALGVTLIMDDGADHSYASANATSSYNITANNDTASAILEYEAGVFGEVLNHLFDEECLAQDPARYKRTAKVGACVCVCVAQRSTRSTRQYQAESLSTAYHAAPRLAALA